MAAIRLFRRFVLVIFLSWSLSCSFLPRVLLFSRLFSWNSNCWRLEKKSQMERNKSTNANRDPEKRNPHFSRGEGGRRESVGRSSQSTESCKIAAEDWLKNIFNIFIWQFNIFLTVHLLLRLTVCVGWCHWPYWDPVPQLWEGSRHWIAYEQDNWFERRNAYFIRFIKVLMNCFRLNIKFMFFIHRSKRWNHLV